MITREQLIENCERGFIKQELWENRDTPAAQMQLGIAYTLLKAGCDFALESEWPFGDSVSIEIRYKGFAYFEGYGGLERETFYIPTKEKLDAVNGNDWY